MNDQAARKLAEMKWKFADYDPGAVEKMRRRIADKGRTKDECLRYSELVDGVEFCLPNVNKGEPFQITEWNSLQRAIIGDFLGKIAADSYQYGGFLASALVVSAEDMQPGSGLFALAKQVGLPFGDKDEFWVSHVNLARAWYSSHPE